MCGDDPDPTVTTVWVGSGEVLDTHARGRLKLVGCAEGLELREEKRETRRLFPENENVRRFDRL